MTEQLKTCADCKECWLTPAFAAIGIDYDNGALTRSQASDKVSSLSKTAGQGICPDEKIQAGRKLLVRINSRFSQNRAYIATPPSSIVDIYYRDRGRALSDSLDDMRGFKRGIRTLGRRV